MKFVGRALVYRMQEAAIVSQFQCFIMFEAAIESRFESPPPLANRSFVVFVEKANDFERHSTGRFRNGYCLQPLAGSCLSELGRQRRVAWLEVVNSRPESETPLQ